MHEVQKAGLRSRR